MTRSLAAMAAAITLTLCPAPSVVGAAARAGYKSVIRDCVRHGQLTHRYADRALRLAVRRLPADVAEYTNCAAAIRSQRAIYIGRGGARSLRAVLDDCADGLLVRRYRVGQLRRALRATPTRYAHGACRAALASQLAGRRHR